MRKEAAYYLRSLLAFQSFRGFIPRLRQSRAKVYREEIAASIRGSAYNDLRCERRPATRYAEHPLSGTTGLALRALEQRLPREPSRSRHQREVVTCAKKCSLAGLHRLTLFFRSADLLADRLEAILI